MVVSGFDLNSFLVTIIRNTRSVYVYSLSLGDIKLSPAVISADIFIMDFLPTVEIIDLCK